MESLVPRRRKASVRVPAAAPSRRHRPDYRLLLFMGLLVLVGVIVLFAISPYQIHRINSEGGNLDQSHYMLKQLAYLGIGTAAFVVGAIMPLKLWRRLAGPLLVIALVLSMLLALLGALHAPPALCFNGACRWFDLGVVSFQPAELLKFSLLLFGALFLGRRMQTSTINSRADTLLPLGILLALAAFFVIGLQKDMGTGLTILGMMAAMTVMSGMSLRLLALGGAGLIGLGLIMVIVSPHRLARVTTFLNTTGSDASSYHIDMAKLALGSGGLFGRGLGEPVQAFGYLPEALNDSIFAVLGEIFGFVGLIVILTLFGSLLVRMMRVAEHVSDPVMKLLAAGAFGWLATHVIVNIGAMTGLLPLTGVTLPFLSFGGTSLMFMMATLGIVYQISRFTTFSTQIAKGGSDETTRRRRGIGGARYPGTSRHQRAG